MVLLVKKNKFFNKNMNHVYTIELVNFIIIIIFFIFKIKLQTHILNKKSYHFFFFFFFFFIIINKKKNNNNKHKN